MVLALKEATYVREMIEDIFNLKDKSVPVEAIVDNKGTVDAVHSTTAVSDKRLRRDVSSIKEQLRIGEISSVSWCSGKDQLADCMTKRSAPGLGLMQVFQTGRRNLD